MRKILTILFLTVPFILLFTQDIQAAKVGYVANCQEVYGDCPPVTPTYIEDYGYVDAVCCCDKNRCYSGGEIVQVGEAYQDVMLCEPTHYYRCGAAPMRLWCTFSFRFCPISSCIDPDGCNVTCPDGMYDQDQGFGSKEFTCTDDCDVELPDYCFCPDCLESCPAPLLDVPRYPTPPAQNLVLTNFRNCTNDCGIPSQGDCYEDPSPQPTEVLASILAEPENSYGFSSRTHSGIPDSSEGSLVGTLNDPIQMVAEYTDTNGIDDMEALAVWFRDVRYSGEPRTPVYLSTSVSPLAPYNDSWGFMLRKVDGEWIPYVPSYENAVDPSWVKAYMENDLVKRFAIAGNNGRNMVMVTINRMFTDVTTGTIWVDYTLEFSGSGISEYVAYSTYNILLMGLDVFSFTPHDNYSAYSDEVIEKIQTIYWPNPDQLRFRLDPVPAQRYARDWTDTGFDWTIDKTDPSALINVEALNDADLKVTFNTSDTQGLYAVIGNIYYSDMETPLPILLKDPSSGIEITDYEFTPSSIDEIETMGHLVNDVAFKVSNISGTLYNGDLIVDVKENNKGKLHFVLTVYDDAGNMSPQTQYEVDLNDWFATTGGLAYSKEGTSFVAKETTKDWSNILPPFSSNVLVSSKGDFSTEMWANDIEMLIKSDTVNSYAIYGHDGYGEMSYYSVFSTQIQKKGSADPDIFVKEIQGNGRTTHLEGSITGQGFCAEGVDKEYCVILFPGDLEIDSGMVCDKKAAIFVDGNLNINTSFGNTLGSLQPSASNGCIFIVSGAMNINQGEKKSTSTSLGYDVLNGYFLVDGVATIYQESTSIFDGVYINGGLHSQAGIEIDRSLRLVDRLHYPALAIENHSKYGVIAGKLFGSGVNMQKVEVGVKPF